VITKQLTKKTESAASATAKKSSTYANKQAHAELAEKMMARDPSTAPNVGDRIAYVMLKGSKGQKAWQLAEDPLYVLQNDLHIDFDWYVEKQVRQPIARLFEAVIPNVNELFAGEHTRKRYQPKMTTGALSKFVKVQNTCLGCKAAISSGPVCQSCKPKAMEIYSNLVTSFNYSERLFNEFWSECQRCQQSYVQEVLCSNNDCPIFYRREKVKKDL
jgi:DNA polymerase delta subunit 1